MGKMGASSWLNAVKKALSPTKGSVRRGEQEEEDHKKKGKKRWIFSKSSPYERTIEHKEAKNIASPCNAMSTPRRSTDYGKIGLKLPAFEVPEQRRAMAVAMATTAAAEAAVATAQAAVEVIRLATPSIIVAEIYAAVVIQAAFRGYLARRALKALKGVVQLQAFVRGYNVRQRAKMTLQYMQSLLWVQNLVCDHRKRLSLSPLKNLYQLAEMKYNSRSSTSSVTDDEYHPYKSKEANFKREKSLAHAFSRQIWRSENHQQCKTRQKEEKPNPRERIKTLEIDTSAAYSPILPRNQHRRHSLSSPIHTTRQNLLINSLTSPHRSRTRAPKAQSSALLEAAEASPPPRYMAATESAEARVRSHSTPRQRPPLERERERESGFCSAKKRLSFAVQGLYEGV